MFDIKIALLIFVIYFLIDIFYTKYIIYVTEGRAIAAANTASLLYLLMAMGVINYTENHWYLVPLVLGNWLGSYVVVKYDKRKNHE